VQSCEYKQTGANVIEFYMVCIVEMWLMFSDRHINEQIKQVQTVKPLPDRRESGCGQNTHDFSHGLYFLVPLTVQQ